MVSLFKVRPLRAMRSVPRALLSRNRTMSRDSVHGIAAPFPFMAGLRLYSSIAMLGAGKQA